MDGARASKTFRKPSRRLKYGQAKNSAAQDGRNANPAASSLSETASPHTSKIASASVMPRRRIVTENDKGYSFGVLLIKDDGI